MADRAGRYADGSYAARYPDWHTEDAPWKAAQVSAALVRHGLTGTRVCDIGCGSGAVLAELKGAGVIATGVGFEPSPDAEFADTPAGVELRRSDATAAREQFDVALMLDVFEHVPDYLGFLESCRGLAPWFVFHIPLDLNVYNLVRKRRLDRLRAESGHLHYFGRGTALATLEDVGFEVVSADYTHAFDAPVVASSGRSAMVMAGLRRASARLSEEWTARLLGGLPLLVVCRVR